MNFLEKLDGFYVFHDFVGKMATEVIFGCISEEFVNDSNIVVDLNNIFCSIEIWNLYIKVILCDKFTRIVDFKELLVEVVEQSSEHTDRDKN